ncbi:unnamed protein product [Clonostachys solani]|uniref:Only prolin and serin are matching in the corresponding protein n=1 Tax=Clonostachys solani TaxID=160281 RepID=A0A9N9Z3W3_9HYPO|nr:unnamed protein product [Clonostachys solani]
MSSNLKPLLLPQLVEERKKLEVHHHTCSEEELAYTYHTTNSSSSDIATPLTPTFSSRGHYRTSSSTSSIDLAYLQCLESPASPVPSQAPKQTGARPLPDVKEEPFEREDVMGDFHDSFGLYSCLCDEPCEHRSSSEHTFSGDIVTDYEFDHDWDCLSDGALSPNLSSNSKNRSGTELPFIGLTSRLSSKLQSQNRWTLNKRGTLRSAATTEISLETALSRATSSRSSSISSPRPQMSDRLQDLPKLTTYPGSCYESRESLVSESARWEEEEEEELDQRLTLERDRAKATTPLLPPLLNGPFASPPKESPLQSPTIAPSAFSPEIHSPPPCTTNFSRPSLSAKPSVTSLRHLPVEMPATLPALLQEYDEWSDRLGHANFTINPKPYELELVDSDTLTQFRKDWDAARVNYTKHLVRTGENYGETSNIYGLTERKWGEIESQWRTTYEAAMKQFMGPTPGHRANRSTTSARSRSRGRTRGRGRSDSAGAVLWGRPAQDDLFAEAEWRRVEDGLSSTIPHMMDGDGKFPARGDEDIVGPMHRAEPMSRAHSEEKYGARFWKNLAGRVGLRK